MPNRTYVEMYVETGRYNYILKDRSYYIDMLRYAYKYLCEHPEKVEEVVKQRVFVGKFAPRHNSFEWLFLELQVINSWILDETFSGDTIHIVPVTDMVRKQEKLAESLKKGIIDALEDDKTPNPIYIPKHIQHRKKGRK